LACLISFLASLLLISLLNKPMPPPPYKIFYTKFCYLSSLTLQKEM
jgi:hypothetical protein